MESNLKKFIKKDISDIYNAVKVIKRYTYIESKEIVKILLQIAEEFNRYIEVNDSEISEQITLTENTDYNEEKTNE